jgi:hypothetical protein
MPVTSTKNNPAVLFVGAIGEKLVEVALLQNNWAPVNLNNSIRHAPNVDILAAKGNRQVAIQVKTAGPNSKSMLSLGYGQNDSVFNTKPGPRANFIVFVRLLSVKDHELYIVPVEEAERAARENYRDWANTLKRDGSKREDNFPNAIRFELNRNRPDVSNYREKWAHYRDAWHLLDK